MKKEVVLLRGHHLRLLYRFVYKNSEKNLWETALREHGAKFAKNHIEVFRKIRDGVVNVKVVDGIDSICQLCGDRKKKTCKELVPYGVSATSEDRMWLHELKLRRNVIYSSKFLLDRLKMNSDSLKRI